MRLLLVEDDPRTADYIVRGLCEAGHACDLLRNGHDALVAATRDAYDVIVADRMVPGLDGLSMIKAVRAAGVTTPTIFLTSIGGVDDRVEGLEAGGDDYLVKPFAFSELL
ncbi:response regulator, partial [Mesorhizobium sp. M8A.F.Ca.ET.208.01.1.1]